MRSLLAALVFSSAAAAPAAFAEDTAAPVVEHTPVARTERGAKWVQIFARVTDASKVFPQVFFRYGAGEYEKGLDMKRVQGSADRWGANVPVKGNVVEYYVEAYDEYGNGPARAGAPEKPFRVDTSGAPPVAAAAPAPRPAPAKPVAAVKPPPPPPAPAYVPRPAPARTAQPSGGRTFTWIAGGLGLGALAGGLIAGNEAKTADKAYRAALGDPGASTSSLKAQYDANQSLGQKATILTIAGGGLLATSVLLFFVEGPSSRDEQVAEAEAHRVTVAAAPKDGGGSVAVAGRF